MTQLEEAVARYHRILESDTVRTSDWVAELRDQMAARHLVVAGRPISPVLRPALPEPPPVYQRGEERGIAAYGD